MVVLEGVKIYNPDEIDIVIDEYFNNDNLIKNNKKIAYFNAPITFDIEVSSFYNSSSTKQACMYAWALDINGGLILGRFWIDFIKCIKKLEQFTKFNQRIIIWVHNLAYEFQFIRKFFDWQKVFALKDRTPVYALTKKGIEFRCSYILSGLSLEKTADEIQKITIKKLLGNLQYEKIRHGFTPLSNDEIMYIVHDVQILEYWIREKIENENGIINIPLTKTGYVRNYCRNKCFYNGGKHRGKSSYKTMINKLTLQEEEYIMLKRCFAGGFTHANAYYVNKIIPNVKSYDFTSSYPAVMLSEQFPMTTGRKVEVKTEEEFLEYIDLYCCMFDIKFYKLQDKLHIENPLSKSKCAGIINGKFNNGRVVSADELVTTITEQDFWILKQFYSWDSYEISNLWVYEKDYLPKLFIESIIEMYKKKTVLKGVAGKEIEYMLNKGMLNACYGMCVTDICRELIEYEEEWIKSSDKTNREQIEEYNKSNNRFLAYPWGVWITAYARRNLFTAIIEAGNDYIYSDTDSIKLKNYENHKEYFEYYNKVIEYKLRKMCEYYDLDFNDLNPCDIKGKHHLIGVWDDEGIYDLFKTLGAKRYMTYKSSKLDLTVSGLNPKKASKYIREKFNNIEDCFIFFDDEMNIPKEYSGRLTHTYLDDGCEGTVIDYLGNEAYFQELSAVHMENSEFTLSMTEEFLDYLGGLINEVLLIG